MRLPNSNGGVVRLLQEGIAMRAFGLGLPRILGCFLCLFLALAGSANSQSGPAEPLRSKNARAGQVTSVGQNTPAAAPAKAYALVIGNDDYEAWTKLRRAVSDAKLVADALEKQHGFQVTRKFNLKGDALRDAFREFFADKGHDPDARLFVWYAGHSASIDVRGEKIGYLVPTDGPRNPADAKFKAVALPMERVLYDYVRATNARQVLIVFDSCFAGIALMRGSASPVPPMQHWKNPVHHYIAAGTAKQTVLDDGVFARLFVDAITGKSNIANANRDGYLTGTELGEYLVSEASRRNGEEQTPVHRKLSYKASAEIQAGEFLFMLDAKGLRPGGMFRGDAGPGLPKIINDCVTKPRHPQAEAISKRLSQIADVSANTLEHKLADGSEDPRWLSIPRNVHSVTALNDGVHLYYTEGGELIMTPVTQDAVGFAASETILLQGGWLQLGNYGCVEFTFNVATRSGEGLWWIKRRNRYLPEVPGWSKLPMRTSLKIAPKPKTP